MFSKRLFFLTLLSASLAACGGGNDNKLSQEYGVLLQVNGSSNLGDITVKQYSVTGQESGRVCTQTVGGVEVPFYDNYEDLLLDAEASEYCSGTRLVAGSLSFQARFLNNTYNPMPISYTGVGVEIRIYAEDGTEIWNSLVDQTRANLLNGLAAYDPFAPHSLTLAAGEAYPHQIAYAINYTFIGDSNYVDSDGNPDTFDLVTDFNAIGWNRVNQDASFCEPGAPQQGVVDAGLGNDSTRALQKPLCQTVALLPGRYRVAIQYSFVPAVDPVEFHVTIEAPDA